MKRQIVQSGNLQFYCVLQQRSKTEKDEGGGRKPAFLPVMVTGDDGDVPCEFWADINPVQSYETSNTGQQKLAISHLIETHWQGMPVVSGGMRIVNTQDGMPDRIFAVQGAINVKEQDQKLRIQVSEQLGVN